MLLEALNAEELRAQNLVTAPRRERRLAPEGATDAGFQLGRIVELYAPKPG
jgi:hypothetical protein